MITGLDHVAFAVADTEASLAFYRALGLTLDFQDAQGYSLSGEDEWRAMGGTLFTVQLGEQKIWMCPHAAWQARGWTPATLRAPEARPGTADICFVWEGTVDRARAAIEAAGAEVIDGPVEREGGAGAGRRRGQSLYFRDPDANLLELIVYSG